MQINVAIVEDETQIRESLAVLINGSEGFCCEHTFANAEDAIVALPLLAPDVVLMDIHLPQKSGIDCISSLKPLMPATQFLICTSFEDSETVFKALVAGATGYLVKTTQPSRLLDGIVDVYKGGSPISSHIARQIVTSFQHTQPNADLEMLTTREREILELLSKGFRYKEIGDRLFLSTETVRTHIRNIYTKLQVNSRTEALNKVYKR